ncbi:MAG: Re/Si-specific NAD(P)(+) transhydrogenase subunit alpha [Acidobacteriaceae bacterium]
MQIVITNESHGHEARVALVPDAVRQLVALGCGVQVERGCGIASGHSDEAYAEAGAGLSDERAALLRGADVLTSVNLPQEEDIRQLREGCAVIGFLRPLDGPERLRSAVERGITLFAMELVPRISRAQSMDALSSMATIAGYKAVVLAAERLPRMFPLLMTAAGTIPPARVLVLGAGVAGLQAIATARRLGAVVEAYDVRAAAGEQVKSLGAKFLEVDLGGMETEDKGGYARELSEEALERGRQAIQTAARQSDVIITTAQVPGKAAPLLIRREAVEGMRAGSVIVDLAAPAGGNCELTRAGETQVHGGVTLLAPVNLPATVPAHASQLYSRNMLNLLKLMLGKNAGAFQPDYNDEIVAGCCVARGGEIVNARVRQALELAVAR